MKSEIIGRLGQSEILAPSLIAEGLAANDRLKVRLSVLQAAARHARDRNARFQLAGEARAAGLDSVALESLVEHAAAVGNERMTAVGLNELIAAIWDDSACSAPPSSGFSRLAPPNERHRQRFASRWIRCEDG